MLSMGGQGQDGFGVSCFVDGACMCVYVCVHMCLVFCGCADVVLVRPCANNAVMCPGADEVVVCPCAGNTVVWVR